MSYGRGLPGLISIRKPNVSPNFRICAMNGSYALLSMRTSNERTGKMPSGLGDFMPGSQNSRMRASAATAGHAMNCQIQNNAFRTLPLDVCAHLPVQFAKHFRTDQLVHHIGPGPYIIPKAVGRHVPGACIGLRV